MDECKPLILGSADQAMGAEAASRGAAAPAGQRQGLTLVHFSAQSEPYLTRNTPFTTTNTS